MKNCVTTATYGCDPSRVWLYLSNLSLNHWYREASECEITPDGMDMLVRKKDGGTMQVQYTRKEKPRRMDCTFSCGKAHGNCTMLLLGGGDSTSVECTLTVDGLGLFAKPQKLMDAFFEELRAALGE
ncbi:MAG: hypothetical protein ACI4OL_00355 [Gemmiger sp.]